MDEKMIEKLKKLSKEEIGFLEHKLNVDYDKSLTDLFNYLNEIRLNLLN